MGHGHITGTDRAYSSMKSQHYGAKTSYKAEIAPGGTVAHMTKAAIIQQCGLQNPTDAQVAALDNVSTPLGKAVSSTINQTLTLNGISNASTVPAGMSISFAHVADFAGCVLLNAETPNNDQSVGSNLPLTGNITSVPGAGLEANASVVDNGISKADLRLKVALAKGYVPDPPDGADKTTYLNDMAQKYNFESKGLTVKLLSEMSDVDRTLIDSKTEEILAEINEDTNTDNLSDEELTGFFKNPTLEGALKDLDTYIETSFLLDSFDDAPSKSDEMTSPAVLVSSNQDYDPRMFSDEQFGKESAIAFQNLKANELDSAPNTAIYLTNEVTPFDNEGALTDKAKMHLKQYAQQDAAYLDQQGNKNGQLDLPDFVAAVGDETTAKKLFSSVDADNSNVIELNEQVTYLSAQMAPRGFYTHLGEKGLPLQIVNGIVDLTAPNAKDDNKADPMEQSLILSQQLRDPEMTRQAMAKYQMTLKL